LKNQDATALANMLLQARGVTVFRALGDQASCQHVARFVITTGLAKILCGLAYFAGLARPDINDRLRLLARQGFTCGIVKSHFRN
jgi:hypothetical protein